MRLSHQRSPIVAGQPALTTTRPSSATSRAATCLARTPSRISVGLIAAVTIVLAVDSAVQVDRVGDSGARAAWSEPQ
ncbi:hypothetical protein ACFPFQ_37190 [Pseudonocardia sp. GCM10023141]